MDARQREVLRLLAPAAGERLWHGGVTVLGCVRGVSAEAAAWRPADGAHSIWELTLHLAYWKYAVRRSLEGSPKGRFWRAPSNWPGLPEPADESAWRDDRQGLRTEHGRLIEVVRGFDPRRLDDPAPGSGAYRYLDLMHGIVLHDVHHVAQIQAVKRLWKSAPA